MLKPLPGLQQRVKVTTWGFPYLWLTLPCLFTFNLVRNLSCLSFISKSTAHGAPWASSSYHLYSYNSMWSGHSVSLGQIQSGFAYIKSHPYLKKEWASLFWSQVWIAVPQEYRFISPQDPTFHVPTWWEFHSVFIVTEQSYNIRAHLKSFGGSIR